MVEAFPSQAVSKILGVYPPLSGDTYVSVKVSPAQLKELIDVGAADPNETQNDSPTIQQFRDWFWEHPCEVSFIGYVIFPPRNDARVSIEGFEARVRNCATRELFHKRFGKADEYDVEGDSIRAWWD